jgi:hypothetical protein
VEHRVSNAAKSAAVKTASKPSAVETAAKSPAAVKTAPAAGAAGIGADGQQRADGDSQSCDANGQWETEQLKHVNLHSTTCGPFAGPLRSSRRVMPSRP